MIKKEILDYFNTNGKLNSNKTRKLQIPSSFNWVDSKVEYLYCFNYNITQKQKCYCGNDLKFFSFSRGYSTYCSSSCANKHEDKIKKFKENVSKIEENGLKKSQNITQKAIKTSIERYGVAGYNNREKEKQTKLERYGDENYNNQEKNKNTCLERYGTDSFLKSEEFKNISKASKLERYGDENYNNQEKNKNTCLERYGVSNVRYLPEVNKKIQESRRKTMESNGSMIPLEQKSEFEKYKREVWKITSKQDLKSLENFNKRGMAGIDGAYHLDHITSIFSGFSKNISVEIIGNITNLRMIPWQENYKKGKK